MEGFYTIRTNRQSEIFDLNSLKLHQQRARSTGFSSFVDKVVLNQVLERLAEINRKFVNPAIVGGKADIWSEYLNMPSATLISDNYELISPSTGYDLVIHALSLHWYNDPVGQLIQVRKLLKPDGLMLCFMFGGKTLCELRSAFYQAELSVENGVSPRVAPMGDIRDLGNLLVRAGFALTVADKTDLIVNYESPLNLLKDLRKMGETNNITDRRKSFLRRETLEKLLSTYAAKFGSEEEMGLVRATFEIICLTGWAPSASQQKPIRPGSAKKKFSQVLGQSNFND